MLTQDQKAPLDVWEQKYYDRRSDELAHKFLTPKQIHERVQREIEDIRRKRNDD